MLMTESTLTERYQTTIPETVRRALGLQKRDKIGYDIRENGAVVLFRAASPADEDPALGSFLTFLAQDIAEHPEHLVPLTGDLLTAMQQAAAAVPDLDMDAPLSVDDE